MNDISKKIVDLWEVLQKELPDTCSMVTIEFTSTGWHYDQRIESPSSLEANGKSMKNLKGEWIK